MESSVPIIELDDDLGKIKQIITLDETENSLNPDEDNEKQIITLDESDNNFNSDEGKEKQIITLDESDNNLNSDEVPLVNLEDDDGKNEPVVICLDDDKVQNKIDAQNIEDSTEDIICDSSLNYSQIEDDVEIFNNVITLDDSDHLTPETISLQCVPKIEEILPSTSENDDVEINVKMPTNPLKSISNTNTKLQECKKCHKLYPTILKLNNHSCTSSKTQFQCSICNETFFDKTSLSKHIKAHSGGKPYICDICFKEFSDKNILRMHYNTHTGEKPFACTICDKVFPNTLALRNHYQMHIGEKPYVCDVCLSSFDDKTSLCNHKLEEHQFLTVV